MNNFLVLIGGVIVGGLLFCGVDVICGHNGPVEAGSIIGRNFRDSIQTSTVIVDSKGNSAVANSYTPESYTILVNLNGDTLKIEDQHKFARAIEGAKCQVQPWVGKWTNIDWSWSILNIQSK